GHILDHCHPMTLGNLHDSIHLGGMTGIVHDHDGSCMRGDTLFDVSWIDTEGIRIDICKYHRRSQRKTGECGGPVGHAWTDNLVTDPDMTAKHRGVERSCTVVTAERILHTLPGCKLLLELHRHIGVGDEIICPSMT